MSAASVWRWVLRGLSGLALCALVEVTGCQRPEPPADEPPEQQPAVELPDPFEPGALAHVDRRATALRTDLGIQGAFAHDPHGQVSCETCHESVPGHRTHAQVACTDCHPAPTPLERGAVGEAECLDCHHVQQTVRDCTGCHEPSEVGPLNVVQTLSLSVWDEARDRSLPFDHTDHAELDCARCHSADARQTLDVECASCHEEHHEVTARCVTCHAASLLDTHDASAHRGCGGAGCHDESARPVPASRARCLSCHVDEEDHEPGQECSRCHLPEDITPPPSSGTGGTPP